MIFGNTGKEMKMNPMDLAKSISHIRKTAAILNKIGNIIPTKYRIKCIGVVSNQLII
jgi:hypothetical protein